MDEGLGSTFVCGAILLLRDDLILGGDGVEALACLTDIADDLSDGHGLACLVGDLEQDAGGLCLELHARLIGHDL